MYFSAKSVSLPSPSALLDELYTVGDRWTGEATGGSANTILCDVNAERTRPAPSAFNLPLSCDQRSLSLLIFFLALR